MVEFAIIMPVLFMLLFGTITGGIVMNRQMSLTHSTREAARYGATIPLTQFGTPSEWANHVRDVAVERSGGQVTAGGVCVALLFADNPTPVASTGGVPCIPGDIEAGNRVQVTATLPGQEINAILFRVPVTLTSDATAKHEE